MTFVKTLSLVGMLSYSPLVGRCDSSFLEAIRATSGATVQWQSEAGIHYRLLSSLSLTSSNWTVLAHFLGNGGILSFNTPTPFQQRFYRIEERTNPLYGKTIYSDGNMKARTQAALWGTTRPDDATSLQKIYDVAQAIWIGSQIADPTTTVQQHIQSAQASNTVPVFAAYHIPYRDCSGYSQGGAENAQKYKLWVDQLATAIDTNRVVIILEPDALAQIDCLPTTVQAERFELIRYAVETLKTKSAALVYLDAGHARWKTASEMATRLRLAGVDLADGFSLNVSNFIGTDESIRYAVNVSQRIGDKHCIIDTSRNGLGPAANAAWCNPPGRALGKPTTTITGHPIVDAFIWIKRPGESDGPCNGGPSAGTWWPEYALELARRSPY